MSTTTLTRRERKTNAILWAIQAVLALLFLFAGGMKLVAPPEMLKGPVEFPVLFLRFIGVCEFAGGLGLILPGLLRIRTGLTPLAAAGLVVIMVGATATTVIGGMGAGAVVPFVVGILAASVAYGRSRWVPLRTSPRRRLVLQPET
jgi:uncharacterized membrane protein YphA (DoxX/SURF4 family)